jgi:hypothetical protein
MGVFSFLFFLLGLAGFERRFVCGVGSVACGGWWGFVDGWYGCVGDVMVEIMSMMGVLICCRCGVVW